jgi:hypothetical protein
MIGRVLPSESEMFLLKRELNALLWTSDIPEVPENYARQAVIAREAEQTKVNLQCAAHTIVSAGVFLRRGFGVTTRGGQAFVLETSPDGVQSKDSLNQILRHWWLSLDEHGLVDLSLHGEHEDPLIYCNGSPQERWRVEFSDNQAPLDGFLKARQRGCFYVTLKKMRASLAKLPADLGQMFPPAKALGIALSYGAVMHHCEKLLEHGGESLAKMPQAEAWAKLASA